MQATVSVSRQGEESRATTFEVTSAQGKTQHWLMTGSNEDMINEAFHNFVRNMILDPQFIEPLK